MSFSFFMEFSLVIVFKVCFWQASVVNSNCCEARSSGWLRLTGIESITKGWGVLDVVHLVVALGCWIEVRSKLVYLPWGDALKNARFHWVLLKAIIAFATSGTSCCTLGYVGGVCSIFGSRWAMISSWLDVDSYLIFNTIFERIESHR